MVATLTYALSLAVTAGSILGGVGMFAWRLERREGFARRAVLLAAALVALCAAGALALARSAPSDPSEATPYLAQLLLFSALIPLLVELTRWLFDAGTGTALFCCTAGYAVQNLASGATELAWQALGMTGPLQQTIEGNLARCTVNVGVVLLVYVPFYLLCVRRISRQGLEQIDERALLAVMAVVMLGIIGFDLVIKDLTATGLALPYVAALRLFHALTCTLTFALEYELLVSRRLRVERATTERVLAERERQYARSRENIEAINVKCHDIRHQIRRLADGGAAVDRAVLDDIAREVDVYDTAVRTGNDALDTILTEKSLACRRAGVTLSCIADGAALGFMAAADIYALFGNALDNALEAVEALGDPERRSISLVVRRVAGVVSIHVENPCGGTVAMRDGLPETTKADRTSHGFGVRSMRLTVERYGGTLAAMASDGTFHVNAIVPLP